MGEFLDMLTAPPKGLRRTPQYRPAIGEKCRVSGPGGDDDKGYTWIEATLLWANDVFVLYGKEGCWPSLDKWEHTLFEPLIDQAKCASCGSEYVVPRKDAPPLCLPCDPDLDRRAALLWREENPDESVFAVTWERKLEYALRVLNGATP